MAKDQVLQTLTKAFKQKSAHQLCKRLRAYVLKHVDVFSDVCANSGASRVEQCVEWLSDDLYADVDHALDNVIFLAAACAFDTRILIAMPKGRVFVVEPPDDKRAQRTLHIRWQPFEYSLSPMHNLRASI